MFAPIWVAIGQVNYALSRTLLGGGCASHCGNSDADTVTFPVAYLQEIACYRAWPYPSVPRTINSCSLTAVSNDPNAPKRSIT